MIRLAPASGLHAVTFQLAVKRDDADARQALPFSSVPVSALSQADDPRLVVRLGQRGGGEVGIPRRDGA